MLGRVAKLCKSKEIFDELIQGKESIELSLGFPLDWDRLDNKKACRISTVMPINVLDELQREQSKNWFYETGINFQKVFRPRLQQIT